MILISQADLARRCGVSRPAIFKHAKPGGKLYPALVKRGKSKRIDIAHPVAVEYMKLHGVSEITTEPKINGKVPKRRRQTAKRPGARRAVSRDVNQPKPTSTGDTVLIDAAITDELGEGAAEILARMQDADLPTDPRDFYSWSLRQIVGTFGASESFKKYLECVKLIEVIEKERAAVGIKKSELVNRDVLKATLWGPLEMLFQRLIGDTPRTIARQTIMKVKAGDSVEILEAVIRKRIGTELVNFKSKVDALVADIDIGVA